MPCYNPKMAYDLSGESRPLGEPRALSFRIEPGRRPIPLPCGKCVGCRLDKSREWANRCVLEALYHDSSYFVTLTYDDAHVPSTFSVDENGEAVSPVMTLAPRDFTLFLKRLRYFHPKPIRYFGCGEYGSHSLRPHYHVILFGLELDDLKRSSMGSDGAPLYTSDLITRAWSVDGTPIGNAMIGDLSWASAAYVARYALKKSYGPADVDYEKANIVPEFVRMSRRPGIGMKYFDDHPYLFNYSRISVSTPTGGVSFSPPAAFKRKFRDFDPIAYDIFSRQSSVKMRLIEDSKKGLTNLDFYDRLKIEEASKKAALKALRNTI